MKFFKHAFTFFISQAVTAPIAFGASTPNSSNKRMRSTIIAVDDVERTANLLGRLSSPSGSRNTTTTTTTTSSSTNSTTQDDDGVFTNGIIRHEEGEGSDEHFDIDTWEMLQDVIDGGNADGKNRNEKIVDLGDTTHFAQEDTEFRKVYDSLAGMEATKVQEMAECMSKVIIEDIHFTQLIEDEIMKNPDKYTPKELEDKFNQQLIKVGAALEKYLPPHLRGLVNMANPHSVNALIGFYAHYAPTMSKPVEGRKYDYCPDSQCCVHTMKNKLPAYLFNENKGVNMDEYSYGGKTDFDHSDKEVFNDLIPFLLKKSKTDAGMRSEYTTFSNALKLESFYHLMAIGYNTERRHLLLARVANPDKTFQLHIPSAATAFYIMGLEKGSEKYLMKYVSKNLKFTITIGCHPQVFLMGAQKNRTVYPVDIAKVMARHLVELYSPVIQFKPGFENKTEIMNKFGKKHMGDAGVDLGVYSHLSALVEETGLVSKLDSLKDAGNRLKEEVTTLLRASDGWNEIDIDLFVGELDDITIELVMSRVKRFRAGAKMQHIASLLPETVYDDKETIPDYLDAMIEVVASTLGKTRQKVL